MARRKVKNAWYLDPQRIVSLLLGLGAMGSWVIGSVIADAKERAKVERVEEKVTELDKVVAEHASELTERELQQQLMAKDLEYVKQQGVQILEVLKEIKKGQ